LPSPVHIERKIDQQIKGGNGMDKENTITMKINAEGVDEYIEQLTRIRIALEAVGGLIGQIDEKLSSLDMHKITQLIMAQESLSNSSSALQ